MKTNDNYKDFATRPEAAAFRASMQAAGNHATQRVVGWYDRSTDKTVRVVRVRWAPAA
jgi:hypothetical protein